MVQTQRMQHTVNGVDVDALKETISTIARQPNLGAFQFRAANQWLGGSQNRSTIKGFFGAGKEDDTRARPFTIDCDEPQVLLGKDQAPNPAEHLLSALAGCVTTTMAMHAAARGIDIESISSEVEGDIDVRGFLGLSEEVPRGFKAIRVTMRVKSTAPVELLAGLAQFSPVFNTITHGAAVELQVLPQT